MPMTSTLELSDSYEIPRLGFGVFQIPPGDTASVVERALTTGYRAIDTAAMYGNEAGVGEATARSQLARSDLFVTTKLGNGDHGRDKPRQALRESLDRLGYDSIDLYLIHWPLPDQDLYVESWHALCDLHADGVARSIGVSNFSIDHLQRIIDASGRAPVVNQVELHPTFQQAELRAFHAEHGIATEAWGPLGRGAALRDETIAQIASEVSRTPAQVVLRWHLQLGNIVIPKSVTPERIAENFDVFDFELTEEQMETLADLDTDERIGPDPDEFTG